MAIKTSWLAPRVALVPALLVTAVAYVFSILWTIYMSFTRSRRLPEFGIDFSDWARQYERLFNDGAWAISLKNLLILGVGSALAIAFGFLLAVLVDAREERRGDLPDDLPLSAGRVADRHGPRLALDDEPEPRHRELPALDRLSRCLVQLAHRARHGDVRHHPRRRSGNRPASTWR